MGERLEIRLSGGSQVIVQFDLPDVEGQILGRSDAHSSYKPDVDLAAHEARDKGVSRRHAVLVRYRGALHVIDLSSVNGTFLNGKRLLPDVPYPVNSGDQLSLANLNLILSQVES